MMSPDLFPSPRVLVVDDDRETLALLTEILEAEGCLVRTADTGAMAMRILHELEGAIELLVLDFGLPDTDGTDLARRAADSFGPRPTIFVTGWVDEFVPLSDVPGRWVILQKPIAIPKLMACMRSLGVDPSPRRRARATAGGPASAEA